MNDLDRRLLQAEAFVFDFYGTLVVDDVVIPDMWQEINERGYRSHHELQAVFEPNAFDGCVIDGDYDSWSRANWHRFLELSGVPADLLDETLTSLLAHQAEFTVTAAPAAQDLIDLLRGADRKIGICSNWEYPLEPYLERIGLLGVDAIATSAAVGARKPHPALFSAVCSDLEVAPDAAVFVGDTWFADIAGSLRHGMLPVWIRHDAPTRGLGHLVLEFATLRALEQHFRGLLEGSESA